MATVSDVYPRCSAAVDHSVTACENHDVAAGLCDRFDRHHAVHLPTDCTNGNFASQGWVREAVAETVLLTSLAEHGLDMVSPDSIVTVGRVHGDYDEEFLDTDPLRFTFAIDDELVLTADADLQVIDVTRRDACGST